MADPQFSAPSRADTGVPTSGVPHVRTRLTADFTVLANALVQRRGSAVTIGVAAYIASLPDGTPVSIAALCEHFTEGEVLISRALRELEAAGYLERRRVQGAGGRVRTRTYFYDVPPRVPRGVPRGEDTPAPTALPRPRRPRAEASSAPEPLPATPSAPSPPSSPSPSPSSLSEADPRAVALLASLRTVDPRLLLSGAEVARLAPAVARWLAAGVEPALITETLTSRLPDRLWTRPSGILAFRLAEPPLPVPAPPPPPAKPAVLPFQTCDGCERAFRAATPGLCRDCRTEGALHAAC
ncbi:hypothetical protein [Streptomyces megasporus]|uniref:hypothetical protein n=1 Tax=Streptomyces megasporus TaxID=44060 RepID=UPI0004E21729|nr:hypothetical protein [Streptomyces megasporus]